MEARVQPGHPQPRSRRLLRSSARGGTEVPIGRNAGGHGKAGMESEEGTAFWVLSSAKAVSQYGRSGVSSFNQLEIPSFMPRWCFKWCSCDPRRNLLARKVWPWLWWRAALQCRRG